MSLFLLIDVIRDMVNCTLHSDDLCTLYNLPNLMNTFIIVSSRTPKVFQHSDDYENGFIKVYLHESRSREETSKTGIFIPTI